MFNIKEVLSLFKADQEEILALLASWSFHRKPTAKHAGVANTKVKKKEKDDRCKKENIHRKREHFLNAYETRRFKYES